MNEMDEVQNEMMKVILLEPGKLARVTEIKPNLRDMQAVVKGDIICASCDFWGKIDGNFYVKDTLSLKDTCVVTGDLHIRRLQVDLDATFNGNCKMIDEAEFTQLTTGERPAMYDIPEPVQEEDDTFKVSSNPPSPFSIPSNEIPEA